MFKSILITFLISGIIYGAAWYSIGRNDLGKIRTNYDRSDRTLQGLYGDSRELRIDSDGFAGDLIEVTEGIRRGSDRIRFSNERLRESDGISREQSTKVDQLESWNRQYLIGVRDFGDRLYELRQLNKESRN